jgi:hypothetical protein
MGSECYVTCMLDSNEIRADERNVVNLTESTDNMRMVDLRSENGQEVSQEGWLFLEIECQRPVITVTDVSIHIIF